MVKRVDDDTKKARGTYRKDRVKPRTKPAKSGDVKYPAGTPKMPAGMSAVAQTEWRRIVKLLSDAGVIADVDRAVLTVYCETWADVCKLQKIVQQADFDYLDENCRKIVRMLGAAETRLLKFAQQLGCTPASRSRVKADPDAASAKDPAAVAADAEAERRARKFFGPRIHEAPPAGA